MAFHMKSYQNRQKHASVSIKPLKMSLDVNISEPDEFNCNELHGSIKEIAKLKGVEDFSYHVDYMCGKGENFIANIFRVTIRESEDKQFSVIVKTLINTTRQELFHELHKREAMAYNKVVRIYSELQEAIQDEARITLPECLYSSIDEGNEVIILEDLKVKGFEIDNRLANYERLDFSQVSTVVKNLAKFHSLTFIYEKHDPETFRKVKSEFRDIIFSNSFLNRSKLRNYFHDSFETSLCLVENLEAKMKLESVKSKLLDILQQFVKPGEMNVLCHGDCWINNVMFKNEDTEETKICFIDYQAMRYASPATDILHFIYLCTDSAFRSAYFENLLDVYYDNLKSFLNLFKIDANSVYPREDFDKSIKETLPYGLLMALIELRIVTTTSEDDAILKGGGIVPGTDATEVTGEVDYFKTRVNDLVNESIENGVLDKLIEKIGL